MTWRAHVRIIGRDPALLVWCLFLLLSPVYVVRSGLPQPGDWLVLLLAPLALLPWNGRLDRTTSKTVKALLLFTLWVALVNYAWATIIGTWLAPRDFVMHPFFYMFNAAVFLSAIVIARRDPERFLRITVDIVFVTIIACVLSSFVSRGSGRTHTFFNSPNQLGYYALLSACLFAMTQRALAINRWKASFGVTCCAYLGLLSASRASLAGILLLLVVLLVSDPRMVIVGVLASIGLVTASAGPVADALEFNQKRALEDRDPDASFAEERGYDRIWRHPQHLLLGAGEGSYKRFARPGEVPKELHSSFGSLLFSYGIVGVALFALFGVRAIRGASLRTTLLLVPALVYTVAHQGLRFTMFWVVLVAFVVLKTLPEQPRAGVPPRA
jgi:hypothetical protein